MVVKARTIVPVVNGQKVIGPPKKITGFTPLAKMRLPDGSYVVLYRVDDASNPVVEGDLDLTAVPEISFDVVKNNADASITGTVQAGNNYVTRNVVNVDEVTDVGDEIEGIKKLGNRLYVTIKPSSGGGKLLVLDENGNVVADKLLHSTLSHAGGFLYAKDIGKFIIPVSGASSTSDTVVVLVDPNTLDVEQIAVYSGKHFGNVIEYWERIAKLGDWDTINICDLNIETRSWGGCTTAPALLNKIQDADFLGNENNVRNYIGVYQRRSTEKSYLTIYSYDGSTWNRVADMVAPTTISSGEPLNNGIGVADYAYYAEVGKIFRTRDVFVPIMAVRRNSGDKFNVGLSRSWPAPDQYEELFLVSYSAPDWGGWKVRGLWFNADSLTVSDTIAGDEIVVYHWGGKAIAYNGSTIVSADIGLPGGALTFGVQTWNSATEDFDGEAYLIKAVPFVVVEEEETIANIGAAPRKKKRSIIWYVLGGGAIILLFAILRKKK